MSNIFIGAMSLLVFCAIIYIVADVMYQQGFNDGFDQGYDLRIYDQERV